MNRFQKLQNLDFLSLAKLYEWSQFVVFLAMRPLSHPKKLRPRSNSVKLIQQPGVVTGALLITKYVQIFV